MTIPNGSSLYCLPFASIPSRHLHLSHRHSDTWEAFQPYPPLESERMPVSILCIIPSLLTHKLRKFGSRSFIHLWTQRNPPSFISFYISVYTSGSFWFLICFLLVRKFHLKSRCTEKVGGWTDFSFLIALISLDLFFSHAKNKCIYELRSRQFCMEKIPCSWRTSNMIVHVFCYAHSQYGLYL